MTLLLIIHISIYFRILILFSLGGLRFFDYFVLVNWHHLLLCKQDKQHTVTLACSMFIIHVPFLCQIFHISARRSLLLLSASLGGERQRVWNFRGVIHCRDVARGSDRMISLCTSWALFSLSIVCIDGIPTSGNQYRSSIFQPVQHGSLPCCWGRISYSIPFF